ncbi:uncharacterized protein EAE98_007587 [Botrytis deweyae]|uniref:Uncharacterized protein n=1 Tax=Botrytis deweyae TaxID=2478750 RepID=A0ABQ7IGR4_9HELO|nr:uncharacterized protein EAE98_007587 [Botrytis deweyae]KAF7923769.1 hypothetical protein EAE98_007587 [Botrytis deweyae]
MNYFGTMDYAHDLCSVVTGPGRYGSSVDPSTVFIAIPSVLFSVYCPANTFSQTSLGLYLTGKELDIQQLRYLVWKEDLPGPRIVHLGRRLLQLQNGKSGFRDEAPSTIHMAYVFYEAYMVVLEEYKQVFDGSVGFISQIWFDFDIDTLHLDGGPTTKHSQVEMNSVSWSSDFQKVKCLAVFSYSVETHGFPHHIRNFSMRDFASRDWLY